MKKCLKYSRWALLVATCLGVTAQAAEVTARSGFKLTSADGKFDAAIGGRIQFDGYIDDADNNRGNIGSDAAGDAGSSFSFRRVWLSLAGDAYGFQYHIDYDFPTESLNQAWIGHGLLPGGHIYIGQHKPWASLDELASTANTPLLERNVTSATGIYTASTYTQGVYYGWHHSALSDHDSLWAGASFYSLTKQSGGSQPSTQGAGYNIRVAYAPFVSETRWAHVGLSFIDDNADNGSSALKAGYAYGGRKGAELTLASYALAAAGNPHTVNIGAELAGAYGPLYLQGEYVNVDFHQSAVADNSVSGYSATAAYSLTGETRPYIKTLATYGGIKPLHSYGAFEVAVRYDHARSDGKGGFVGLNEAGVTDNASLLGPVTAANVSLITVGLNYYFNPAVRFALNFEHGRVDLGAAGKDNPNAVGARAQIVF